MQTSTADGFFARKRTQRQLSRLMGERVVHAGLELIVFYAHGFDRALQEGKRARAAARRVAAGVLRMPWRRNADAVRVKIAAALPRRRIGPSSMPYRRRERAEAADRFFARTGGYRANLPAWIERERYAYVRHLVHEAFHGPAEPPTPEELAALTVKPAKALRIKRDTIIVVGMTEQQAMAIATRALEGTSR